MLPTKRETQGQTSTHERKQYDRRRKVHRDY
nr:MAG TPA: hypothetical protein [Caudoviricetes sp.]